MKILITGACGHIGSYFIENLYKIKKVKKAILVDSLTSNRFNSLFNTNTKNKIEFHLKDLNDARSLDQFKNISIVFHFASMTNAEKSFGKEKEMFSNNLNCLETVIKFCKRTGAKLVHLSSTSVYGTQDLEVDENCSENQLQPQSPYAKTKIKEEKYVSKLQKSKALKSIHCRFGTIYGASPGMRFHTAVNKFCWQAVMGQPITVWKTAYDQYRPYLDLQDASAAIVFIIKNDLFDGRIYNVLSDNLTVRNVVETIKHHIPSLEVVFVENAIMNQLSYKVLDERFRSKGFKSSGNLKRGISETIALLKNSNHI